MAWPVIAAILGPMLAQAMSNAGKKADPAQLPTQGGNLSMEPTFAQAAQSVSPGPAPFNGVQGSNPMTSTFGLGLEKVPSLTDEVNSMAPSPLKDESKLQADLLKQKPSDMLSIADIQKVPEQSKKASIFGDMTTGDKVAAGATLASAAFRAPKGPAPPGLPGSSFSPMTPQFNKRSY